MNQQQPDALPPVNLDSADLAQTDQTSAAPAPAATPATPPAQAGQDNPLAVPSSPTMSGAPPATGPMTGIPMTVPAIADDVDLIEKEWVQKAKQIVEHTKHDPYQQNEEMTKMKADYLKKRYNRDIKLKESTK